MTASKVTWTIGEFPPPPQSMFWQLGQGLVMPAVMGSILVFVIQTAATDVAAFVRVTGMELSLERLCAYLIAFGYALYLCLSFLSLMRATKYGARIFAFDVLESVLGFLAVFAVGFIGVAEPFGELGISLGVILIGLIAILRFDRIDGTEQSTPSIVRIRLAALVASIAAGLAYFVTCSGDGCTDGAPQFLHFINLLLIFVLYCLLAWYARERSKRAE